MQKLKMMLRLPSLRFPFIPLLMFLALLMWFNMPPNALNYTVVSAAMHDLNKPRSGIRPIKLPFSANSLYLYQQVPDDKDLDYLFFLEITGKSYQRAIFHITPDDCVMDVKVNGFPFEPLKRASKALLCDHVHGFVLDISPYVKPGSNLLEIKVRDTQGGKYGIAAVPQLFISNENYMVVTLFLVMGLVWATLLHILRFGPVVTVGWLLSLLTGIIVLYHSPVSARAPDYWGHVPYVQFVARFWTVPPPHMGWEFYHQPLYYFCAALFGQSTAHLLNTNFIQAARHFSLLCVLAFELYGLLFIRRAVHSKPIAAMCSLALLSWPLLIVLNSRISNEVLLFALWAPAYYHLLRWYQERKTLDIAIAIALCGFMMVTKTSALVPMVTIGTVGLVELAEQRVSWRLLLHPWVIAAITLVALATSYNFGRALYYKLNHAPQMGLIVGNMYMDPKLREITIPNTLYNFIGFDLKTYLTNPWFRLFDERTARQLFWNSYLKSSLYGFFSWPEPLVALYVSIPLLLLVMFAIGASFATDHSKDMRFMVICIISCVGMQMLVRIVTASVDTNDARMTFPVVMAFLSLIGLLIQRLIERRQFIMASIGGVLLCSFFSLAYYYMYLMAVFHA